MEHRVRDIVGEYVARVRQDLDARGESLSTTLSQLAAEHHQLLEQQAAEQRTLQARLAEMQQALQDQQAAAEHALRDRQAAEAEAEIARASEMLQAVREARVGTLERVLGAFRRIDQSDGLNTILDALTKAVASRAARVAILLVDGYMLRPWGHTGFEAGTGPGEMPLGASGTLAAAVAMRRTTAVPPAGDGQPSAEPAFMRLPAGRQGCIVPLLVGGDVVAVLYADDLTRADDSADTSSWTDEVELLARHAAVRLENVTSHRAVEVLARST